MVPEHEQWDADVIIVGSGFGGAVTALRLTEAGYKVLVLEQGKRLSDAELLRARKDPRRYLWAPPFANGFFWQRIFRHVGIIGGRGLGGGSIVWAGVLLDPPQEFTTDPLMTKLGVDWEHDLRPYVDQAAKMLGRQVVPHHGVMDAHLAVAAREVGTGSTYGPVPLAVHFGVPGATVPDPFFGGLGPDRTGCRLCGECLLGCPYGAKNQLTRNYLYLAEKLGARIQTQTTVTGVAETSDGGYQVQVKRWGHGLGVGQRTSERLRAPRVVLAGGVLGTTDLLFNSRRNGGLPRVSPMLGSAVRTNSEALTAILAPAGVDLSIGTTISSDFHPDDQTHTTQNRYVGGWHMRFQIGPMTDGFDRTRRARHTVRELAQHPVRQLRRVFARDFIKRLTVLTTMQRSDNELALIHARQRLAPWRFGLRSAVAKGSRSPSYIPVANDVTRAFAASVGGEPLNLLAESVGGLSITAHILGGAVMGTGPTDGVVDVDHEVFGHRGLFIVDASVIPANLGVNPSLTIAALAERFAQSWGPSPARGRLRETIHATGPAGGPRVES